MLYITLDPGKSTGMTVINNDTYIFGCTVEDFNWMWLMEKIETLCENEDCVTIITEDYRIYPGTAVQQAMQKLYPSLINGMLMDFVRRSNKNGKTFYLIEQWAANAKAYASDQKLKEHSLWKGTRHQKDSARHYVYYVENLKSKKKRRA